jgi:protein-disulfide isomerase
VVDGIAFKGAASAPVVLLEFVDFQCPACAQFATEVLPELERDYVATGKVRFGVWHRPLSMHQHASLAAAAAECAAREDKFWSVHYLFFAHSRQLDPESIVRLAQEAGVGRGLEACMVEEAVQSHVKALNAAAQEWSVVATPTTFLGVAESDGRVTVRQRWSGVRQAATIARMVEEALAAR